ncbi:hypothetical protein JTE90_011661 [Oedothorax gibbosus]|uniref:Uncharacterized protein n=1 Tax=Oedothorax gibbosus TaxID=931172 RepID=A0AAV6TPP7_9ARAC|nr:hypothetical protein JTE90_011661 [Oedothorax gibbosus]
MNSKNYSDLLNSCRSEHLKLDDVILNAELTYISARLPHTNGNLRSEPEPPPLVSTVVIEAASSVRVPKKK